jgi:hypothetical protein
MTDADLRPGRWEPFSDIERQTIATALATVADAMIGQARRGELDEYEAQGAAMTVLLAGRLTYSISEFEGEEHPSMDTLNTVCGAIAKGGVPAEAAVQPRYPVETLDPDDDDGTMPANVAQLEEAVVGHRIVKAEKEGGTFTFTLTLDDGRRVTLRDSSDCCAFTGLEGFLAAPDMVDHVILGVGTTGGYTKWHIYADLKDALQLDVAWSCGNPFYYGYGFDIAVEPAV